MMTMQWYSVYRSYRPRDSHDPDLDASVDNAWTEAKTFRSRDVYGQMSEVAGGVIDLCGVHFDVKMTIIPECGFDAQLDFGHGFVQTVSLGSYFQALDFIPVEPDDELGGKSRYLRHATDQQKGGQRACSGTVRLLRLREDIALILTPSRGRRGAWERLGIFHQEAYQRQRIFDFVLKMPEKMLKSRIKLV